MQHAASLRLHRPPRDGMSDDSSADINYTKEAFLNSWNLTFLAVAMVTAATLGLLIGGPVFTLLLLFAGAGELLFLGTVPRQKRFRRAVRAKKLAARRRAPSQKELYGRLSRRSQRRYAHLRKIEDDIEENYRKLSSASQSLLKSHISKIDGLLGAFLNLLHRRERFRDHSEAATESEVRRSIEAVRDGLEKASPRVRKVKERRLRILKQRLKRFREGGESLEVIEAQLQTIEDTVKYIHEQSWTLQNPDEITYQLDTLLDEIDEAQDSVREVEDVFHRSPDELLDELEEDERQSEEARRNRSRQRG